MGKRLLVALILSGSFSFAQKFRDTVYFVQYNSSIIAAYEGQTKGYDLAIEQYLKKDSLGKSKMDYRAESDWSNGLAFNFDKIGFSFGYSNNPPADKAKKGNTQFLSFGLNVGGNKWILEANFRQYKGFYDLYTSHYDTNQRHTGKYYQQPGLNSSLYKLKFLYFTNHKKFAFKNCYSSSYRQLKTAATWVITANAYYNTLNSDSSIIASPIKSYYNDFANLNGLDVFAFSVYGGVSLNLVIWKHLMVNATLLIGPEDQFRTYKHTGQTSLNLNYVGYSGDLRGAIGFNYSKFFTYVSGTYDITNYRSSQMLFKSTYYMINFTMGFRIHTKYPKFYQKLQQTRLYKLL
jgi:hypothetical protein